MWSRWSSAVHVACCAFYGRFSSRCSDICRHCCCIRDHLVARMGPEIPTTDSTKKVQAATGPGAVLLVTNWCGGGQVPGREGGSAGEAAPGHIHPTTHPPIHPPTHPPSHAGGIALNTEAQLLREVPGGGREPIPGLYGAGEVTGGVHGKNRLAVPPHPALPSPGMAGLCHPRDLM